jgi:hypothetical protein
MERALPCARKHRRVRPLFLLYLLLLSIGVEVGAAVTYPIVYVRAPRYGDSGFTKWAEVINPVQMEPGADLMLLQPDGREEVLFAAGNGAVIDPVPSLDARGGCIFLISRMCAPRA